MSTSPRLIAIAFAIAAQATPALAETDFQQWLSASARVDLDDNVNAQAEVTARLSDGRGGLYELEQVLLLGYKLSDQVTAAAGYVHNPSYDAGEFVVMEHRAREQIAVDNFARLGSVALSGRLRFEQRWRDGIDGTGWRVRPYVKAAVPLGDKSAPVLSLSAEPFFNLNTTSFQSTSGLDRLRSAVSLGIPLAKSVRLEAGYLNQHRFIRGDEDSGDHVMTASLALSF